MSKTLDVLAVVGPTASGKTSLSVALAKALNGEIINGDSTQVYKGFDIGTAKITEAEKQQIPHHLFDWLEPTVNYTVADYQSDVRNCIHEIRSRGKLPIIVGGTGLYVQSVLYDFRFTDQAADEAVRERLEMELEKYGPEKMYAKLMTCDPLAAEKIHPNNHRRMIRALEIFEVTGKTKDEHESNQGHKPVFDHLIIGLEMDREKLYERINQRTHTMMAQGFLEEVERLLAAGYEHTQPMGAIGYRELKQYVDGKRSYEAAIEAIQKSTRNYAKRQMTYFKNKLEIEWFSVDDGIQKIVQEVCTLKEEFEND